MSYPVNIPQGNCQKELFNILKENVLICFVFQTWIKMADISLMYVHKLELKWGAKHWFMEVSQEHDCPQ